MPEAVYTASRIRGRWVQDVERGVIAEHRSRILADRHLIGDWYYNRNWKYRGADWVIHMLVD